MEEDTFGLAYNDRVDAMAGRVWLLASLSKEEVDLLLLLGPAIGGLPDVGLLFTTDVFLFIPEGS